MRPNLFQRIATAVFLVAATSSIALADCPDSPAFFRTNIVTYYETTFELPAEESITDEWDCDIVLVEGGRRMCRIKLVGVLHSPSVGLRDPSIKFPAIILNHGSEEEFEAATKGCGVANYFVPKGYMVFVPFRRGQGDIPNDARSTGIYIETMLDDFEIRRPEHTSLCADRGCYKAQLLKVQADVDLVRAFNWLKARADMKKERSGDPLVAIMGSSYGGAVTVLVNRLDLGQKAAVPIAPAAQNWGNVNFAYAATKWKDAGGMTDLQEELLKAAQDAKSPAFYIQAKWDFDTRATVDLAYAHAYGGNDPKHGRHFMASIFPYEKPGPDPIDPTQLDYESVHKAFASRTDLWGTAVLDFFKRNGVK